MDSGFIPDDKPKQPLPARKDRPLGVLAEFSIACRQRPDYNKAEKRIDNPAGAACPPRQSKTSTPHTFRPGAAAPPRSRP
ncbi:MAG: hypothetical protein OEV91_01645 [Desulfobulbaceae bacterium]|nr:hypothetical protein [Desulfobulbaceae bacterium]